jgi:2-polyprenyl-3-methyl-5-hydroxy-6-metoxy-1,4-benzoquinol methylase
LSLSRTPASRLDQARKIQSILHDFLGEKMGQASCLDLGCSDGSISARLAASFRSLVGIDVDQAALKSGAAGEGSAGAFAAASGYRLPFENERFDVVICAQVYEHVSDQPALAGEVWRVLKPGGVCFFSGPNRLAFMEEHYWLPLLSWLPRPAAHLYMRAFHRGQWYDAYPRFYWQIRALWRAFTIHDYTLPLLREPDRFAIGGRFGKIAWIGRLPSPLLKSLAFLVPNYNWILEKPA